MNLLGQIDAACHFWLLNKGEYPKRILLGQKEKDEIGEWLAANYIPNVKGEYALSYKGTIIEFIAKRTCFRLE